MFALKNKPNAQHFKNETKKHRFRFKPVLSVVLSVLMILGMMPASTLADTKVYLKDAVTLDPGCPLYYITTNEKGEEVETPVSDNDMIGENDQLRLKYSFNIPQDKLNALDGNTRYYVNMPAGFVFTSDEEGKDYPITMDIKDASGAIIQQGVTFGHLHVGSDGIYVTFDESVIKAENRAFSQIDKAYIYVGCERDKNYPPDGQRDEYNRYNTAFDNGMTLSYGFKEDDHRAEETKANITKSGATVSADGRSITWTITYTPFKNTTQKPKVEIHDKFSNSDWYEYVGDGKATVNGDVDQSVTFTYDGNGGLVISGLDKFNNTDTDVIITYTTKLKDEIPVYNSPVSQLNGVSNSAEVWDSSHPDDAVQRDYNIQGAYAELKDVKQSHTWLSKKGTVSEDKKSVKWQIVFDPAFKVDELSISDYINPKYMEAPTGLTVNGVSKEFSKNGDNYSVPLDNPDANGKFDIKYTTVLTDDAVTESTCNNTANVSFKHNGDTIYMGASDDPLSTGTSSNNIASKSGTYTAKHTISWTVSINPDSKNLTDVTFTDDLSSRGLTLIKDSVKFYGTEGTITEQSDKMLVIHWDKLDSMVTVSFETKVDRSFLEKWQDNCYNSAVIDYTVDNGVPQTYNADSSVWVSCGDNINKSAGTYNSSEGTIEWTINVNNSKIAMKNAVITDVLPEGLKYVPGSLSVNYQSVEPTITTDNGKEKLTITLGEPADGKYVNIYYKTTVPADIFEFMDGSGSITFTNNAELSFGMDEGGTSLQNYSIPAIAAFDLMGNDSNSMLSKEGKYNSANNKQIDYTVKIDPYNLSLTGGCTVADYFDKDLGLIEDSVELYKCDQWWHRSNEKITGTKLTVYDDHFELQLPEGTGQCILEYSMEVKTPKPQGEVIENQISMFKKGEDQGQFEIGRKKTSYLTSNGAGAGGVGQGSGGGSSETTGSGELWIKKTVQNSAGGSEGVDNGKSYIIEVTLTKDGAPLKGDYKYRLKNAAGEDTWNQISLNLFNGTGYVELKNGETACILDLPAGTEFEIIEDKRSSAGYTVTYSSQSGTIEKDQKPVVTVNNKESKPDTGELIISKELVNSDDSDLTPAQSKESFEFIVSFDPNASAVYDGKTITSGEKITLSSGGSAKITDIPFGTTVTVTENISGSSYKTTVNNESGTSASVTIDSSNKSAELKFKNEYQVTTVTPPAETGKITITKTVTGDNITENELHGALTFTIEKLDENGKGTGEYLHADGSLGAKTEFTLDKFDFKPSGQGADLANGTYTLTIENVPTGKYMVTETETNKNIDKYTVSKEISSNGSVTVENGKESTVNITNTYTRKTGQLTITKTVAGDNITKNELDGALSFTIEKLDENGKGTGEYLQADGKLSTTKTGFTLGDFEPKKSGTDAANGTYTLTIKNVPTGRYMVTENNEDIDKYTLSKEISSNGSVTVSDNAESTVSITNTYTRKTGGFSFKKTVKKEIGALDPAKEDPGRKFRFTVKLDDESISGTYGDLTFTNGEAAAELSSGGSVKVSGIPTEIGYTITEDDYSAQNYTTAKKTLTGTVSEKSEVLEFVNTYNKFPAVEAGKGRLIITKSIDGKNITKEEFEGALTFTVKTPDGKFFDAKGVKQDKETEILLKDFNVEDGIYYLDFNNIDAGDYIVREKNTQVKNYDLVSCVSSPVNYVDSADGAKVAVAADTLMFRITDSYNRQTGKLSITKSIDGLNVTDEEKAGALTFVITNENGMYLNDKCELSENSFEFTIGKNFKPQNDGTYLLSLDNVPVYNYTVTEKNSAIDGYELSYEASKTSGTAEVTESSAGLIELKDVYTAKTEGTGPSGSGSSGSESGGGNSGSQSNENSGGYTAPSTVVVPNVPSGGQHVEDVSSSSRSKGSDEIMEDRGYTSYVMVIGGAAAAAAAAFLIFRRKRQK